MDAVGDARRDPRAGRPDVRRVLAAAWPVMVGYVAIGLPCGILCSQVGMAPWMCFLMSVTFYSGAGQFMLPNLWLAGTPIGAIIASISFVNTRQMLYAASFAPTFARASTPLALAFSATVTDESFGVNTERMRDDASWKYAEATLVNLCCMLTWATANLVGAALGSIIDAPIEMASFAMTSIFICLLVTQAFDRAVVVTVAAAMAGVYLVKLAGLGPGAILVGALVGMCAGLGAKRRGA